VLQLFHSDDLSAFGHTLKVADNKTLYLVRLLNFFCLN